MHVGRFADDVDMCLLDRYGDLHVGCMLSDFTCQPVCQSVSRAHARDLTKVGVESDFISILIC